MSAGAHREKVCPVCGARFVHAARQTCSRQCGHALRGRRIAERKARQKAERAKSAPRCVVCGGPKTNRAEFRACSPECGHALIVREAREKRKRWRERAKPKRCPQCQRTFGPRADDTPCKYARRRFCCVTCANRYSHGGRRGKCDPTPEEIERLAEQCRRERSAATKARYDPPAAPWEAPPARVMQA